MAIAPIAPQGIHHLAIQCRDLTAMVRFYEHVLRLPVVRRWPLDPPPVGTAEATERSDDKGERGLHGGLRAVWLGIGTAVIALERVAAAPQPPEWDSPSPGLHLVALQIFPYTRQLWREHLALYDVAILYESEWTLYIRDPEGNRVGLSHFPEPEAERQRTRW